jgi:hypothetical protein
MKIKSYIILKYIQMLSFSVLTIIVIYKLYNIVILDKYIYYGVDDLIYSFCIFVPLQLYLLNDTYVLIFQLIFYIIEIALFYYILKTNKINGIIKMLIFVILYFLIYPIADVNKWGL